MVYPTFKTKDDCIAIEDSNDNCTHTNPTDFLISYCNFWYYTGICPFRFKYSTSTQEFKIIKNVGQKICCALSPVLTTIYLLTSIRNIYVEHNLTKEMNYFAIAKACGNVVTCWCFFLTIWKYDVDFESLVNKYSARTYTYNTCANYPCFLKVKYLAPLFILSITLISVFAGILSSLENHGWNFSEIHIELIHKAQMMSLRSNDSEFELKMLVAVYVFGALSYQIVDISCQLLVLISAFSLICSISALRTSLTGTSITEVFHEHSLLKAISRLDNQAVGVTVFGVVFGYIPFFMHVIPEIIQPRGPFAFANSFLSICMPFAFLILAAKVTNKATSVFEDALTTSIKKCQDALPLAQLNILLFQLSRQEIGFSVGGFIKLNSSFLGAVLSLVLTFAVVIIQFNMPTMKI